MSVAHADIEAVATRTPRVFAMLLRLLAVNWTFGRSTVQPPNGETHVLQASSPAQAA